jgi:hypothetical protein
VTILLYLDKCLILHFPAPAKLDAGGTYTVRNILSLLKQVSGAPMLPFCFGVFTWCRDTKSAKGAECSNVDTDGQYPA